MERHYQIKLESGLVARISGVVIRVSRSEEPAKLSSRISECVTLEWGLITSAIIKGNQGHGSG